MPPTSIAAPDRFRMGIRMCAPLVVVGALLSTPAEAQVVSSHQADTLAIRALESALMEALRARDLARLGSLVAANYVLRGEPDVDRDSWLRAATEQCWGDQWDMGAFQTRQYSSVVMATFLLTLDVDPATCRPVRLRSLITDLWVLEAGAWKLQMRHAGPPPPDGDVGARFAVASGPPPTWKLNSEISAVATGGNTSTRTVGLGAEIAHRGEAGETDVSTRFLTTHADAVTQARSLAIEGRHGFAVAERIQAFADASYARDRFAGIGNRATASAGIAYQASRKPAQSLTVQGGLGLTVERRLDATTLRFATATGALDYGWTVVPGTELREQISLSADLESRKNWRATGSTALAVSLNQALSLRASYTIEHRHLPVPGFGRSDIRTAVALVLSLARRPGVR